MTLLQAAVATPYRRGVVAVAAVALVWRGWTVARWSWQDDDWVYLADAATMSLPDYMFQIYHGHLMPAEFLVMWVMTRLAPLDRGLAIVLTALASAAVVLLWGRALARVAGERGWLLVPLALVSLSPLLIRPTIWWASALQVLPLQACLAWGVLVAATMARAPTRSSALQLVAALGVGLFFWEKSVLLVAPFVMVLVSAHGGRLAERLRRHWRTLAVLTGVCLSYVALFLFLGRTEAGEQEMGVTLSSPPAAGEAVDFMTGGVGGLLAPATLGGPWGSMPGGSEPFAIASPTVQAVTSLLLVLAAVVVTVLRRGAWVPLVGAAAYTLVSWALVLFSSRFTNLGTLAINDERYSVDAFAVVVLAFVLALARPLRRRVRLLDRAPVPSRRLLVGLAGAAAVSLAVGNVLAVQRIGTHPGRAWLDNVRADVELVGAQRPAQSPLVLWDAYAPDDVLQPVWWNESARLSRMLVHYSDEVSFGVPADQIFQVDGRGNLVPVGIGRTSTSDAGTDDECGHHVEPGDTVPIRMSTALFHWGWGLEMTAFSATGGDVVVDVGSSDLTFDLPPGLQTRAIQFDGEVSETVTVHLPADAPGAVCVADLHVGEPEPRAG